VSHFGLRKRFGIAVVVVVAIGLEGHFFDNRLKSSVDFCNWYCYCYCYFVKKK